MRLTLLLGLAAFLLPAASATETPSRPLGLCTAEPIELQQQARRAKKSPRSEQSQAPDRGNSKAGEPEPDEPSFDSPDRWPSKVPVPKNTRLKEISAKKSGLDGYTYETNNYRFNSQVEMDEEGQETIGRLFECAYAANKAIGRVLPVPRAKGNRRVKEKLVAFLYKNMAEYHNNGGPEGSAGVFSFRKMQSMGDSGTRRRRVSKSDESKLVRDDMVKVPFESLGLSEEGHVVNKEIDTHTLVHELTHQCFCLNNLPVWANEGWAEYVGYVPYEDEVLDFDKCFAVICENAKRKQMMLNFPFSLGDFLNMSQQEMYAHMRGTSDTYMLATMCVTYFVHLNGRAGVKSMRNYMNALLKGESNEKALKKLYGRFKDPEKLQEDFVKSWAEHGVQVHFKD